ncbi:MAG: DUF554 domain-containing protein [Coriobacteriia bacterium]|nr:DUF554 domain-containing protein [Coriobacteriia bacterium]
MPGIGTLVNALAVALGGVIGVCAGDVIAQRIRKRVIKAIGLGVLVIGLFGAFNGLTQLIAANSFLAAYGIIVIIGALVIGTIIGELIDIEKRLEHLGTTLARRFRTSSHIDEGAIVKGFVSASLIYCVGAMTILGSIQDGLGNPQTLYLKSLLDGVTSVFLGASLGIGVAFSAVTILVVQGLIALVAFFVGSIIPELAIVGIEAIGGILIAGVGLNFVLDRRLRIGNMLPAIAIMLAVCWILG